MARHCPTQSRYAITLTTPYIVRDVNFRVQLHPTATKLIHKLLESEKMFGTTMLPHISTFKPHEPGNTISINLPHTEFELSTLQQLSDKPGMDPSQSRKWYINLTLVTSTCFLIICFSERHSAISVRTILRE
jgi:hypothetical protein